ncbi:hypothetical protein ARMGADRAFT_316035 [Armillaria gallica]|uniref:Uncharacterized protein n=1 Tax=Armillaria gallica TaxID=47427 RepID=A0A2H3D3F3_ARMGA|nr:hypothetical protein ARMGADRAFT_316035 [Armillaria gallica]
MWECEGCDDGALVKALQTFFTFIVIDYRRLARWRLAIIGDHAGDTFRVVNLYRNGSGLRAGSSGLHVPSLSTTCSLDVGDNWGLRRRLFRVTICIHGSGLRAGSSGASICLHPAHLPFSPLYGTYASIRNSIQTTLRLLADPKFFSFPLLFSESLYTRFYCVQLQLWYRVR